MTNQVERFDLCRSATENVCMWPIRGGQWVRYSDYEKLRKQRDEELRERVEKALEKVERLEMHMDHGLLPLPSGRFVRFHDVWLALSSIFEEDSDA